MYNKPTSLSYIDSGFNRFFSRSIGSDSSTHNLHTVSQVAGSKDLNFDQYSVSGSVGDKFTIGNAKNGIILNGPDVKIEMVSEGSTVGVMGRLDD